MSPRRIQSAAGITTPPFRSPFFPRFQVPPFPLVAHCCGPVLAVKGSTSPRFAPWTAAGRAGEPDLLRGKRGSVASVAGEGRYGPVPVFGFSWDRQHNAVPGRAPGIPRARPGQALCLWHLSRGPLELVLAAGNRVVLHSLLTLARWFPLIRG